MEIRTGAYHFDKALSQENWRPRPIGIFFSKTSYGWVFLVLIAPMSATDLPKQENPIQFEICLRNLPEDIDSNTRFTWSPTISSLNDAFREIGRRADKEGHKCLKIVLLDIYWGWERYLAVVRNDIRAVCIFWTKMIPISKFRLC